MSVKYIRIPIEILDLGITSVVELMILCLAIGFEDQGITMSNQGLADTLRTDRRNVINAVKRLRKRGLLIHKSAGYGRRILIVNGEKLSLSGDSKNGEKVSQNSVNECIKMVKMVTPIYEYRKYKNPAATGGGNGEADQSVASTTRDATVADIENLRSQGVAI